ncbi:MAG TPA: SMP-30/gluconolactonase/LRE family protein [Solirubrobacterales bacterium]|nr:SMP-30/gluconolactonase/LRE family protein [Solirubrobacterales bacterium]
MRRFLGSSAALFTVIAIFGASAASASPPACTGPLSQTTLYSDQGLLESVIVGNGGKLFYSGIPAGTTISRLYRADGPGATPTTVLDGPAGPGGLAWSGRRLLWGYGNTQANGTIGDVTPMAGLYSVNPTNGNKTVVSDHLGMANGIARAADGTIYASNDFGSKLDRISRKGVTKNGWATVEKGNGMTVGKNGRYLYVNQTFVTPSAIAKIDTKDPSRVFTFYRSPEPNNVIFDGLARDNSNNLYTAVLAKGEVWKITPDKQACVVASGLKNPSSVAISNAKTGYKAGNLYTVGFGGEVTEVRGAVKATVPN